MGIYTVIQQNSKPQQGTPYWTGLDWTSQEAGGQYKHIPQQGTPYWTGLDWTSQEAGGQYKHIPQQGTPYWTGLDWTSQEAGGQYKHIPQQGTPYWTGLDWTSQEAGGQYKHIPQQGTPYWTGLDWTSQEAGGQYKHITLQGTPYWRGLEWTSQEAGGRMWPYLGKRNAYPDTATYRNFTYVAVSGKAKCLPRYGHIQKLHVCGRIWVSEMLTQIRPHIETIPLYFLLFSSHPLRYSLNSLFTCFSSFLVNDHNFPDCLGALMMASTQSFSTSPRSSFPHFHRWP